MDINYDQFNGDALIFKYNIDEHGNPISIKVDKEEKQVSIHGTIQLEFVPDEYNRVVMLNEDNSQMVEVFNRDEIKLNTYYIDYNNGIAYLDKAQFGKIKVYNYYKKGLQLIGCSRIYDEHDVTGKNVMMTLQEIIDAGKECIRILLDIGDAYQIITRLEKNIEIGSELHNTLNNDIEVGTTLQQKLHSDIVEATKWKDQLHTDVQEGKVLQPLLEQTIADGNTAKQQLDQSIADAQDDIAKIEATGNEIIYITSSQWTYNDVSKMYEKQITHTCNSENVHVTCKTSDTKEALFLPWKIVDKNNVLLKSDEAINVSVIISANYYKPLIDNTTTQEVIDARKGEATLLDKINKVDKELNTIENIVLNKRIKTVKDYGAKGDGITDDTNSIQNCIDNENVTIFPKGEYLIKSNLKIKGFLIGCDAKIIIASDFIPSTEISPNNEIAIYNASFSTIYSNPDSVIIKGIVFIKNDGAKVPYTILGLANTNNSVVEGCNIYHDGNESTCGLDLYGCNKNVVIKNNNIELKANAIYGGVWCRQVGVNQVSENIKFFGNTIVNNQSDEVLAVYGYQGSVKNVIIQSNTLIHNGVCNNVITIGANDPTVSGGSANASLENVVFCNNIICANKCNSKVLQISMEAESLRLDNILIDNNIINLSNAVEDVTRIIGVHFGTNIVVSNNNINQNANESVIGIYSDVIIDLKDNNIKGYYKNVTKGKVRVLRNNIEVRHKEAIFYEPIIVKDNYIEPLSYYFCICENNTEDNPLCFLNNTIKTKFAHNITKISVDGNNLCCGNTVEYTDISNNGYLLYVGKYNDKRTVVKDNIVYNSDKLLSTVGAITNINNIMIVN